MAPFRLAAFLGRLDMIKKEETRLANFMKEAAERNYPYEACGLILSSGKKRPKIIECKNEASDPGNQFLINPTEYVKALKFGKVIGVWHTHVNCKVDASDADRVGCEATAVPWFIIAISKEDGVVTLSEMARIEPHGFVMPYLERPYVEGQFDCYSLIRDYYWREFAIDLRDYPRVESDGTHGRKLFAARYKDEGFVQLIDQEPQIGDVFLIQTTSSVPEHMAVFIGDEMIMHHCHDRLSRRDIYGGYWLFHTSHHLRHKSKC